MTPPLSLDQDVSQALAAGAPVAFGISGGKDSDAMTIAGNQYLDSIGHPREKRVLIHADLGLIEWPETHEWVKRLAQHVGIELMIVRRPAGDMIQRWESRWVANLARYAALECVTLITPWSTPAMRFCTSELKVGPICSALKKRFPGQTIISASGIRAEESPNRAKAPISKPQPKLQSRTGAGVDWHPILSWSLDDVMRIHEQTGFPLHPAYTTFGSSRLSCSFCMLARIEDHLAALKQPGNHPAYQRMAALEATSTFSFQQNRWLLDRMPEILPENLRLATPVSKARAATRILAEKRLPKTLLFTAGWPHGMPTNEEATILAEVRTQVCEIFGIHNQFGTREQVLSRYAQLLAQKALKDSARGPRALEGES